VSALLSVQEQLTAIELNSTQSNLTSEGDRTAVSQQYSASYTLSRNVHPLASTNDNKRAQSAQQQTACKVPRSDAPQPSVPSLSAGTPGHSEEEEEQEEQEQEQEQE
jgi:hypothetical protein